SGNVLLRERFAQGTFCSGNVLLRERFAQGTFCSGNVLLRERFAQETQSCLSEVEGSTLCDGIGNKTN
ncbi:MAG: hypothetical protein RMY64_28685, partial [Nostoc sp. DedQUE08]|uniref:hypothetical protein n=1 Tax=Nostoc sp. DedQUE08 TaxID=3075393 RepID=UPI002AD49AAA